MREVEWALLELRKHYSQKQYEEIVIGTSVALSHETSGDFLKMMNSMGGEKQKQENQTRRRTAPPNPAAGAPSCSKRSIPRTG